jgi:hypothetical protein
LHQTFIFDACVAIQLDNPGVNYLQEMLTHLINDRILISRENFNEIHERETQQLLIGSTNVSVVDISEDELIAFKAEVRGNQISLDDQDICVLFLGVKESADFIVSSDFNVIQMTSRYRKSFRNDGIRPLFIPGLLAYSLHNNTISFDTFLLTALNILQNVEVNNILSKLSRRNLNCSRQAQLEIIDEIIRSLKQRFQAYKRAILDECPISQAAIGS